LCVIDCLATSFERDPVMYLWFASVGSPFIEITD